MPRSRNVRLTPVQRDILWAIEESGGESLWTMWVTIRAAHDTMSEDQFRVEFVDGLFGLLRLGYVRLIRMVPGAVGITVDLPCEELACLWVGAMRDGDSVEVEMTGSGREALG